MRIFASNMDLKKDIERQICEICGIQSVKIKSFVLDGTNTIAVIFEESFEWNIHFIPEFLNKLKMVPTINELETADNRYEFEVLGGSIADGLFSPTQGS